MRRASDSSSSAPGTTDLANVGIACHASWTVLTVLDVSAFVLEGLEFVGKYRLKTLTGSVEINAFE